MDVQDLLTIIGAATGIAQELTAGTAVERKVEIAAALKDILAKTIKFHQDAIGEPMDLSKFHRQEPIA